VTVAPLELFQRMHLIRQAEEALSRLFAGGEIPGFIHLGIGQEAVAVGIMAALHAEDTIASTHRGHGHALAKGLDLSRFFMELMGKADGICAGRGGSMHVADVSVGMLGANGIVGAGLSIALGSAWAHQVKKNGRIAVAFFGDGALAEGLLHETLNLAKIWKLPLLLVCENNGWAEFRPTKEQVAVGLRELVEAYRIDYELIDGNDVELVFDTASRIVQRMRCDPAPFVLECTTTRFHGHYEGDAQKYRASDDLADARRRDPLGITAGRLRAAGVLDGAIASAEQAAIAAVTAAVEAARLAAAPDFAVAATGVYTPPVGQPRARL
jgi:TPP-dependent pyruvate/acetoin dehydrogenase alpha subunit